jgi:hypothetical protein
MDMRLPFLPPIPRVRCGAFFHPDHPALPCPRCGLPARFSQPPDAAPLEEALDGDPHDTAAASPAASPAPATSSARIPIVSFEAGEPRFSADERQALLRLRQRYKQGNQDADGYDGTGEFSAEERARLGFVRWLYQSGRIAA